MESSTILPDESTYQSNQEDGLFDKDLQNTKIKLSDLGEKS